MGKLVTAKQLAEIIGLSERRVNQIAKENLIFIKEPNGKFDTEVNIEKYFKNKFLGDKIDYDIEHTLLEKAKREKAEIELQKIKNKMHDADDVEQILTNMLVIFKTRILALPSKLSPKIAGQKNPAIISDMINKELKQTLLELSEYDPAMFVGGETIEEENNITIQKNHSINSSDT